MIWTAHPNQVSKICETNPELACFQQRLPYKKRNLDSSPNEPNPTSEHPPQRPVRAAIHRQSPGVNPAPPLQFAAFAVPAAPIGRSAPTDH